MNIARKPKLVLLGFLSHFPVAGVAWQTIHYLAGFQRLGFEVFYVEAHGCTPSKLMQHDGDDGPARAAAYIAGMLERFGLKDHWAYHAIYDSRYFGLTGPQLQQLYRDAALIINLHGSHLPTPELTATNRLVFLETDPVDLQIDLHNGKKEAIDYLTPHCAFFTFGENLGAPDCLVPSSSRFRFLPTRQPVVMDFWEPAGRGDGTVFTTVGNWRQPWREVHFNGETLRWSKHFEFLKFISLPQQRPAQPFELALSSYTGEDQTLLESHGWRVRPGLAVSQDLDVYRDYIGGSRAEFTVAKEQNIRLRSGWFSDRAVTYLAAGRPVVTQETGFSRFFPTGAGLFSFSTMDELAAAVDDINADYEKHRCAAREIAREYFAHDVVLGRMLRELGVAPVGTGKASTPPVLPGDLVITPISRWPTRLPEKTFQTALALPLPEARRVAGDGPRASLIIVTHNGLAYTKLCLASLLAHWREGDELIFVDNASTDGTVEFLEAAARRNDFIHVIANDSNRGFAAANNQGLARATGDVLVLLNNDTLVPAAWREALLAHLADPSVGLAGPVTNRTCNEAQIDAPYQTFAGFEQFACARAEAHPGEQSELAMLAMFCVALRRDVFQTVGPLDEQFEVGMFEDDDYSRRVRAAGFRIVCAEGVFVHHFGQASFGELCTSGGYDRVLEANRARFEQKWNVTWQPHARRITPEYEQLRQRIRRTVDNRLPAGANVVVINKGDEELLGFKDRRGWHFPQNEQGRYANLYPADSTEAIAQLETLRRKGADFLLIPRPAFWWLDHYAGFKTHLERQFAPIFRDDSTCLIFDLKGGAHG
jgi:GT2 family glycosyltransferase